MGGGADFGGGGAGGGLAVAGWHAWRAMAALLPLRRRTPGNRFGKSAGLAGNAPKSCRTARFLGCRSRTGPKFGWRARCIREKIIGRSRSALSAGFRGSSPFVASRRVSRKIGVLADGGALALLHQPAGQHRGAILLQPGVQQLSDLLAEIGGVAEPGKFITLQRIAGSGEQKLPGRLGFVRAHGNLQRNPCTITLQ